MGGKAAGPVTPGRGAAARHLRDVPTLRRGPHRWRRRAGHGVRAQPSAAIAAWTFDSGTSAAMTTWTTARSADGQTTIAW